MGCKSGEPICEEFADGGKLCCCPMEAKQTEGDAADKFSKTHATVVDKSSPYMTAQDIQKGCGPKDGAGQKEFTDKGCVRGQDGTSMGDPEYSAPPFVATCEAKPGIPLCGPTPELGENFHCFCYR